MASETQDGGPQPGPDIRMEDVRRKGLFASSWENLQKDSSQLALAVGILVGILTLVVIFMWRKGKGKRDAVLVAGPSNSGKTLLFCQLTHGFYIDTYTSMVVNVDEVSFERSSNVLTRLVDLPGSDKLRASSVQKYRDAAIALIFLVDSSTIKQQLRDSAEFLFKLLSDPVLHRNRVPFLVVCNKQDVGLTAKGAQVIERELAKEIGLLRETHSRLLQDTDGQEDRSSVYLGQPGKDFEFSHLPNKVDFCESSFILDHEDDKSGIPRIRSWISAVL